MKGSEALKEHLARETRENIARREAVKSERELYMEKAHGVMTTLPYHLRRKGHDN